MTDTIDLHAQSAGHMGALMIAIIRSLTEPLPAEDIAAAIARYVVGFIPDFSGYGEALRHLRGHGILIEDGDLWRLGESEHAREVISEISSDGWPYEAAAEVLALVKVIQAERG